MISIHGMFLSHTDTLLFTCYGNCLCMDLAMLVATIANMLPWYLCVLLCVGPIQYRLESQLRKEASL